MNERKRVSFAHSNRLRAQTLWLANDDIYGIAESVTSDANRQCKDIYIYLFGRFFMRPGKPLVHYCVWGEWCFIIIIDANSIICSTLLLFANRADDQTCKQNRNFVQYHR